MFEKILIANRGEIALRILRACREMGVQTVAVHSTADADAMHVRLADESVCIGPPSARESYLNMPALISAAAITHADAIHPGFGFLSENAKFADMVEAHDIVFIGPTAEHIRTMGDKVTAKVTAAAFGLPVTPGSKGALATLAEAKEAAADIGYPILIKAASGGGGKGMKVAQNETELAEAYPMARSEARIVPANARAEPATTHEKPVADGTSIVLPKHPDMHAHIRQGAPMAQFIACHLAGGTDILLAMPNTMPPVSRVTGPATDKSWSIESYSDAIRRAGGDKFRALIVPLYLGAETTADMIDTGAKSGLLRAVKYYPPRGTTNSNYAVPLDTFVGGDVFKALEANGIVLCVHGEQHDLSAQAYFDRDENAESIFYRDRMPRLLDQHPKLRVSCEHLTTEDAVDFVKDAGPMVVGTVTPQHLLYTIGDLIQAWDADLYCKPLTKFEKDRSALLAAVTNDTDGKFIAGTDSAPHPRVAKSTPCGCASGCFTAGIAPQLYAQAFELGGVDLMGADGQDRFQRFMAENAWKYWGFTPSTETIRLVKKPSDVQMLKLPDGQDVSPLPIGITGNPAARSATIPWSLEL